MSDDARHDTSDAAWALLEPLLPDRTPQRGGRWTDHRLIVDAVRWRTRTGSPWRDLPARFGPWQTVHSRHRRWSADGTWKQVLDALRAEADRRGDAVNGSGEWVVSVDSTVVRAHADAAGARHQAPKDVPGELLEELAAAVPAGARALTGSTGSTGPPAQAASTAAASSAPSPAAHAGDQPTPPAGASRDGRGGDGRGAPGGRRS